MLTVKALGSWWSSCISSSVNLVILVTSRLELIEIHRTMSYDMILLSFPLLLEYTPISNAVPFKPKFPLRGVLGWELLVLVLELKDDVDLNDCIDDAEVVLYAFIFEGDIRRDV